MSWSAEELEAKLKENPDLKPQQDRRGNPLPVLAALLEKKESKYHSRRTEYNGRWYASKKEAQKAQELDALVKVGHISFYLEQVPIRLPGNIIYRLDFLTFTQVADTPLYEVVAIDTKGYDTPVSKLKRKQVKELYGIDIEIKVV
jgi:hypothetical protein